ncbi:cytochrome c oxidase assembly protein [Pseudohyphozyma bogoriensis]|nr:cytochrome c oxidase assembly protein [Pseudohyphozyma bogoriensis]
MSCQNIRDALAACILKSDCVLKSNPPRSPAECLRDHHEELPEECQHLRKALFECRRGMLDMRKRFRGLDPSQHDNTKDTIDPAASR